jgi:hypothetical protein
MNLYLISQIEVDGYDTYDSAVVVASSTAAAQNIHPDGRSNGLGEAYTWTKDPQKVSAKLIGAAADGLQEGAVICASFNAG